MSTTTVPALRWLLVGSFGAPPSGRRVVVSGERMSKVMGDLGPASTVEVADRLGAQASRGIAVKLARPRDLARRAVIAGDETLAALEAIAARVCRDADVSSALRDVIAKVGDGRLAAALRGEAAAPLAEAEPEATPDEPPASTGIPIDDIFDKADVATGPAKSPVAAFVSAVRQTPTRAKPAATAIADGREAAACIRDALARTASELLASPAVHASEVAWRSLRMVMAAAPSAEDLMVELLDVADDGLADDGLADAVGRALDSDTPPDAVFVLGRQADSDRLLALAEHGARTRTPVVVEVEPSLPGFDAAADRDDAVDPEPPEAWTELRAGAGVAWLCAVTNPPALSVEDDAPPRHVFGGAAAALAAMTAASVAATAAPGSIVGKAGALVGPAAHSPGDDRTIPVRTFVTHTRQRALEARGLLVLGSEARSDRIRLSAAPMIAGEIGLPGRILGGRAHRAAQAVAAELGRDATPDEVARVLRTRPIVPRLRTDAIAVTVREGEGDSGLAVEASIGAALAGASIRFTSDV